MLRALVDLALRQRVVVVIAAAALIVVGVFLALRSPLDVFPEFAPPMVEVQADGPGMSSESVESLITIPLESALSGLPHMTTLRSKSVQGLSQIQMFFARDANIFEVRQAVSERVGVAAATLPVQVKTPRVLPPLSSTSRVLHVGLTPKRDKNGKILMKDRDGNTLSEKDAQTEISVLMQFVIRPALLKVNGVANVSTYGEHPKLYRVLVRPEDMRAHNVTLDQVKQALGKSIIYTSGGFLDSVQRLPIEFHTRVDRPSDLLDYEIVHRKGVPIYLRQIADVDTGNPARIGDGVINDEPGLFVVVEKFPWGNTLAVTHGVEKALKILEPGLENVVITTNIFRPATFIEQALGNLRFAMILGAVLVTLILIAFLFEWRTAVISLTAIPLSIVSALVVMYYMGVTINTMVLAGLAIAIGEVVDDAIIDVENIMRRLKQNRLLPQPRPVFNVVLDASIEVRSAVVYASFIVAFVCLPIFFMTGVGGAFFRPLAMAYILAVMASLVVALLVTPALCLLLLPSAVEHSHESPVVHKIRTWYTRLLPGTLNRAAVVYVLLAIMLVGAGVGFWMLEKTYLPPFRENDFLMHWVTKPSTTVESMTRNICKVGKEMLEEKAVVGFGSHIARSEYGEEVVGSNFSELWVSLGDKSVDDYDAARHKIDEIMARYPGFQHDLLTYLQERIKEVLSGGGASIVLRTYGDNLETLRARADMIYGAIQSVEGITDLKKEAQVPVPRINYLIDPQKVKTYGLKPKEVADAVYALVNGVPVAEIHQEQRSFEVHVMAHPDSRRTQSGLERLPIDLPGGGTVPLRALLADYPRRTQALNQIRHDSASRCMDVSCNVKDRALGSVVADIEERLKTLPQEEGYRVEILGEYQARMENQRQLLGISILSLIGIAVLLYMDFQSFRLMLLVMLTLPFALIGGVAAALATGKVLSLGSLVGFITVLGIAARNGIMLVSHYRHLETEEGVPFGRELILRGSAERVSPILMTALAAGLGLLPLALSGNKPGYEVEYPMAIVILGGLFTSTLLNLFVLPVLYERFGRVYASQENAA
jgi:CzcA family heavy metal efflux pump